VRVGVQLPEVEREVRWPELRAIALAAERGGFDSIWVGDHMLYRGDGRPERGPWDVWTTLAALAAATERVRLGPLVASLAFHPPGLVARMAASIDEVSQGRFTLGVGAGWNEAEFRAFGIPYDNRVARFEEAFEIVRRLVGGERISYTGRYHQVEDAVLLPRPARPVPLMVGTTGPRLFAAAAPHVDWWNVWYSQYGNTPSGYADLSSRFAGDLERSACVLVAVNGGGGERPPDPTAPPVDVAALPRHLEELEKAGADEAILVLDPIAEASVGAVANVLSFT
jgi:alkanesulfonate monooxygenase SsuD/methylene tetrahydromethanopterin reductase-like flavin-dependent oxidoreductase (luciferase family)